jgi:translation initiation factor IF-2
MSRVRVYELAKEAGMESKILAEQLIALGYNIKSHSSTVEDTVADEIRSKILGTVKTEIVEKRISGKGGATVIRRRSRTVRQEPEEEIKARPETEPEVMEQEPARAEEIPAVTEAEAVTAPVEEEKAVPAAEPAEEMVAAETVVPAEEETIPEPTGAEEITEPPIEVAAPIAKEEIAPEEAGEPKKVPPKVKPRKGLAKVIKKAAIQIPTEPEVKPARPRRTATNGIALPGGAAADIPAEEERKAAKKKGKRLVQIQPDAEDRIRAKRPFPGKRKGRRDLQLDEEAPILPRRPRFGPKGGRGRAVEEHRPAPEASTQITEAKAIKKRIKVYETISVADIAHRMGVKVNQVIAKLMGLGIMATMNQSLDVDTATLVATDFGYEVEQAVTDEITVLHLEEQEGGGVALPRPPVVTVMGHVDHGKTSILDAIRKTDVAAGEAGGITQHIGAYYVRSGAGDVVFLDTPGHAAFTSMRSRGAQVTDVVVLVVAADDGVMDQTKEAINHAQAAQVPIVVAVNKIDKANANPDRVKRELAELGLTPEEWGGETIYCETSAKQNKGIDDLLNNILLQAEILELKADPNRKARGRVIEAQLHKGRGPVATILVQEGTLRTGVPFVVGQHYGKVRSLINDKGEIIKEAGPAMPVEVQGLSGVPLAGDEFIEVSDEKMAKSVSSSRQHKARESELASITKISLDKLFEQMQEGDVKELRAILRADVQGTLEAFGKAIEQLSTDAIKVRVLHEGTGTITDSDVLLASASDAIIIGFNVRPSVKIKELAEKEKVDIRSYDVIYNALDDIKNAMTGMLAPTFKERVIGAAEVRQTFHVPKVGMIAGCFVVDGKMERNANARVLRDGVVIYNGRIGSLRRFKDDAREVSSGYECGIGIDNFNDIKVGDLIEAYVVDEVAAKL